MISPEPKLTTRSCELMRVETLRTLDTRESAGFLPPAQPPALGRYAPEWGPLSNESSNVSLPRVRLFQRAAVATLRARVVLGGVR